MTSPASAAAAPGPADDPHPGANPHGIPPDVYHRRWAVLAVLNISLVVVVTAVSSLNVAIPKIQEGLSASGSQLQWIIDAYGLVFAGLLLPAGALGDRFGRKGALQLGLVVFGLASAVASTVSEPSQLIAARAAMGVGAAFIMPATLSIIMNTFPPHERGKAIAIWAGFAGVGGALGPITSGVLLDHFWWGSVFFVNIPLIVVLLGLTVTVVPTSKDPDGHALDPLGSVLSVVSLVSLVYAVIEGPDKGWTDPVTVGGFLVFALAGATFVAWELRVTYPMLDPRLFRYRGFATGSAAVTLVFFCMFAMFFLLTQYLQFVKGYTPLGAGLRVIPNALMMVLVAPRSPKVVERFGVRRVVGGGFALVGAGFFLLSQADASSPDAIVIVALLCTGAGMGLLMPPSSQQIVNSVPLSKAGVGSAVNDVTREVGGALGIAVIGTIANSLYRANNAFANAIPDPTARNLAKDSVGQAVAVADRALQQGLVSAGQHDALVAAAGHAFSKGTSVGFLVATVVAGLSAVGIGRTMPDTIPLRTGAAYGDVDGDGEGDLEGGVVIDGPADRDVDGPVDLAPGVEPA